MKKVIFWGATGQARVLREALDPADARLLAVFDNRALPSPFNDVPIYVGMDGLTAWLKSLRKSSDIHACVAIGGGRGAERLALQQQLEDQGLKPLTVVHLRAFVARDAALGAGSQILAMGAVCANARLGRSVIVNTAASVDHDCVLQDGVHIGPGAHLAGEVVVEEHVFVGTGAVILPRLKIGRGAIVGAGAVVIHDVAPGTTVVGNPAEPISH